MIWKTSINTSLCLLQGSFDCNGLYQWLPLRGVQSESSVGGETLALVNREHRWRLDLTAAAVPPEFPPFLFLYSLLTSLFVFLIPYFLPDVSDSFMICCRLSFERKKMKKKTPSVKTILFDCTCGNTQGISFPRIFILTSFLHLLCIFAVCVFMFLLYSCCNGWCLERQRERERETRSPKSRICLVSNKSKQHRTNTWEWIKFTKNKTTKYRTNVYILVVFTQHL